MFNIKYTTPLMNQRDRKKYGICEKTNETGRFLEGTAYLEKIGETCVA